MQIRILNAVRNRSALALGAMTAAFVLSALLAIACESPPPRRVEVIKEVEVVRTVEVVKEVEVVRTVEVVKEVEVVRTVEAVKEVEAVKSAARMAEAPPTAVPTNTPAPAAVPTSTPMPTAVPTPAPTPTPTRTYKIAFTSDRDGNYEIYTADADGRNVTRLTFTSFLEFPFDWSPDGKMISYSLSSREGDVLRQLIFTTNADGGNQRPIREEPGGRDLMPVFSPDGREVVFSSNRGGNWDIYIIGVDGENPRQITFSENFDSSPDWSPDGRQIAYESKRDGNWQIYLLDIQSGDERKITSGIAANYRPAFSPDGNEIAYESDSGDIAELFVLDLATLETRQVTRFGKSSCCASWSPDGKFIYFSMRELGEDGQRDIYRISPDGGFPEAVIQSESNDDAVAVSPFMER